MHLRYRLVVLLSILGCLTLGASFAQAAKSTGATINSIVGKELQHMNLGIGPVGAATCVLGQGGTPTSAIDWLLPPNDRYLTLLEVANCSQCGTNGLQLKTAKILLDYVTGCSQPVEVSIVGSNGDPNCPAPDLNYIICPPITYNLSAPGSGLYEFSMPLPEGCCINQNAFLQINFTVTGPGCAGAATRPYLVLNESCDPCKSYNIWASGSAEWCSFGLPDGNPMMTVDADCCTPVSNEKQSWGRLKMLYR